MLINININFSSLNLQGHCAFIVGHTSTTGRHVSLSFDFFIVIAVPPSNYEFCTVSGSQQLDCISYLHWLCLSFISVIAEKVWYMQFTDDTVDSSLLFHTQCAWLSAFSDTAAT